MGPAIVDKLRYAFDNDIDGDGEISFEEFMIIIKEPTKTPEQRAAEERAKQKGLMNSILQICTAPHKGVAA